MKDKFLEKLSIVIPTFKRQKYVLRLMSYWSDKGPQIYVLDGSDEEIPLERRCHMGLNIHYYHLPKSFVQRLDFVRGLIKTDYVMLAGDDEFYVPSGVDQLIEELELNPEIISCCGRSILFDLDERGVVAKICKHGTPGVSEITGATPFERMYRHMRDYDASTIYSVVRRKIWISALEAYCRRELPIYAIGELQFELSVAYMGKSKVLETLVWLRNYENTKTDSTDPSLNLENRFHLWWIDPSKKDLFHELIHVTADVFHQLDGRNKRIIESELTEVFQAYYLFSNDYFYPKDIYSKIHRFLWRNLTPSLSKFISFFIRRIRYYFGLQSDVERYVPIKNMIEKLLENNIQVDIDEINSIVEILMNFHSVNAHKKFLPYINKKE